MSNIQLTPEQATTVDSTNIRVPIALSMEADEKGFVTDEVRNDFFVCLRQQPENRSCFDCAARNASWVSTTFGIFLCMNCSGQHRNLGARVSFVRSVDLDRLKLEELLRMEIGGNLRFRTFCKEHGLPSGRPTDYRSKQADRYHKILDKATLDLLNEHRPELSLRSPVRLGSSDMISAAASAAAAVSVTTAAAAVSVTTPAPSEAPAAQPTVAVKSVAPRVLRSPHVQEAPSALSTHFTGSTSGSKGIHARTDFDFDFDSAFTAGVSAVPAMAPKPIAADFAKNPSLSYEDLGGFSFRSPINNAASRVSDHGVGSASPPQVAITKLPPARRNLDNAKSIAATDFEDNSGISGTEAHNALSKFRNATGISSDAFFNGGEQPPMTTEDEIATRIGIYSEKARQTAAELAVGAQETFRRAANWFAKVSNPGLS